MLDSPSRPVARQRQPSVDLGEGSAARIEVWVAGLSVQVWVANADILHAYMNAVRLVEFEQYGQERLFVVVPDRAGNWLELVAMPAHDADRIIHADRPRPKFYEFLK